MVSKIDTPRWVDQRALLLLHGESLAEHGGLPGVRDAALLDSALARPQQLAAYAQQPDIAALAAAYGVGLTRNHPFVDGNKRAAFLVVGLFLGLNGYRLDVTPRAATQVIWHLAAGDIDEPGFAAWLRAHLVAR